MDRTPDLSYNTECRFCAAEGKPCGRGHFEVLAYEWRGNREVHAEKLATEAQRAFIRKLTAEKELSDRKRANREAKVASPELTAKEASALINELMPLPTKPSAGPRATEKQVGMVQRLLSERQHDYQGDPETLTKQQASQLIDELLALPRATQRAASASVVTEDGMYQRNGEIFKVQIAKQGSGNLYAKKLTVTIYCPSCGRTDVEMHREGWLYDHAVNGELCAGNGTEPTVEATFEYAPGAIRRLRPQDRMTLEQAKEFGKLYGICCRCGADLTDETSIAEGIGPICASKF